MTEEEKKAAEVAAALAAAANLPGAQAPADQGQPANGLSIAVPTIELDIPENERNSKWYLDENNKDLAGVTDQRSNPAIGIEDIVVYSATERQKEAGTIAKVSVVTPVGTFMSISVCGTKDGSALRLRLPGNSYGDPANKKWVNHYQLDQKVRAQVLRYLHQFIKK